MPPPDKCLSVFRTSDLSETQVWKIGESIRPIPPAARADIRVCNVYDTGLTIDADDNPPRHANIVGWPEQDSAVKLKAIELAEKAQLHLR
jgi:hypothetical protein